MSGAEDYRELIKEAERWDAKVLIRTVPKHILRELTDALRSVLDEQDEREAKAWEQGARDYYDGPHDPETLATVYAHNPYRRALKGGETE